MNIVEVTPELWYWTAAHPAWRSGFDWPEEVGCVYYETAEAVVLIDPLVPDDLWAVLDERHARAARPVRILLTAPWHERDAQVVGERYSASIWRHGSTEALPTGVELFVPGGSAQEGQVAFYLPQPRALVVAEFFFGIDGRLEILPSPAERDPDGFRDSLRKLADLEIDHVLVAHGEPVLHSGRKRIAEALHA